MKFEDYCREEFTKINKKIDKNSERIEKLMMFMAVEKASTAKSSKYVSGVISLVVSLVMMGIGKIIG